MKLRIGVHPEGCDVIVRDLVMCWVVKVKVGTDAELAFFCSDQERAKTLAEAMRNADVRRS